MKLEGKYYNHSFTADGGILLTFEIPPKSRYETLSALDKENIKDKDKLQITVSEMRRKRSLNANDYLWVLCTALSEKLRIPKEVVYKKHIKEMGVYTALAIPDNAVEKFNEVWQAKGIGWFCEVVDSTLDGCKKVFAYYGSSTYDTKQMSILIDNVVEECKLQDIETMTPLELEAIKAAWKN